MQSFFHKKYWRLIAYLLVANLSLSSLASASMMGNMLHNMDMQPTAKQHCHQSIEIDHAIDVDEDASNPHHHDSHSESAMECGVCMLCASILSPLLSTLAATKPLVWIAAKPDGFTSAVYRNLDKPPRA